ncbi:MAG TPA: hypothetical protein DHV36_00225, partial [Desulfobacteraceae bacterium]|nr:hypothetical protein [Desulfobacteraceae bacterium]
MPFLMSMLNRDANQHLTVGGNMAGIGFGKKLYISSVGIILMTIFIVAGVNFYQTKKSFLAKGMTGIQSVSEVLENTIDIQYGLQKSKLDSDLGMLITEAESSGNLILMEDRTVDIQGVDIDTGATTKITMPKLLAGLKFLTADYEIVDKVAAMSDSEIMFFQLRDNRLVKVSTSLKTSDDKRAIGAYFNSGTSPFKAVAGGEKHLLLTGSGHDKTLQVLSSCKDVDGSVAGAFGIGRKVLTDNLKILVEKATVNGKGYAFISDGDGKILVHPDPAYRGISVSDISGGDAVLKTEKGFVSYNRDGRSYYGYTTYFKPWDLHFTVAVSEAELMAGINEQILKSAGTGGVIALVMGLAVIAFMNRQLMTSMNGMATMAKEVARGNFNHSFDYKAKDAIRDTVTAMNDMVTELAQMIGGLNSGVDTLSEASGELNRISDLMKEGAATSVEKVNNVASAAEEMSVNMDSVAAAMEEASTNVETVSDGTGRMREGLEAVVKDSVRTRDITGRAVEQARATSARVEQLGRAAEEINKVTDTITSISSQTNLLALNATIEAAR